jgi:hypothetical protein
MKKLINLFICTLIILGSITYPNSTKSREAAIQDIELQAMVKAGVVQGFGNGDLKPNLIVNRGQFATFITRALKLPNGPHVFTDVPKSSPLAQGINSAYAAGLISGYSKKTFAPEKQITRQDALAIIARVLTKFKGANLENLYYYNRFVTSNYDSTLYSPKYIDDVNLNVQYKIIRGLAYGDSGLNYHPKKLITRSEAAAFISRMLEVQTPGKVVQADPKPYKLSAVENGQIKEIEAFGTIEEAKAAITSNHFITTRNGIVIYMTEGIVYLKKSATLTDNPYFSTSGTDLTYEGNQEMKYLGEPMKGSIKIQAGNRIVYAKYSDVTLVPSQLAQNRSHYTVNTNGDLVHRIYHPGTEEYELPYIAGKAPSLLKKGQKYYSWDGKEFFTSTGQSVGEAYQYFNLLSGHSKTKYSAAELNKYINQVLIEKEKLYKNNPTQYKIYKDATKLSKIKGLGSILKEVETKHRVNALWLLSVIIHESNYGMRERAQNNLFDFKDIDNGNLRFKSFPNVAENINTFIERYLNKYYNQPDSIFYYGSNLGNKSTGINVRFDNSPYWGQKVSGIMYSIDQFLGKKDIGFYRIAETTRMNTPVRKNYIVEPGSLYLETYYSYYNVGIPVTIKSTVKQNNIEWHEIVSDSINHPIGGYVSSSWVTEIPYVK